MRVPYAWRPGARFVVLALTVLGSTLFFLWGASTPLLDHVGRIELELKIGRRAPLDARELALVQRALCRHPKIAEDWLEGAEIGLVSANQRGVVDNGYAYLVRMPSAAARSVSVGRYAGDDRPGVRVRGRTRDDSTTGEAPLTWTPPQHRDCPTLIELVATTAGDKPKPARVRVSWSAP
jgi:hypothetical protein